MGRKQLVSAQDTVSYRVAFAIEIILQCNFLEAEYSIVFFQGPNIELQGLQERVKRVVFSTPTCCILERL